MKFNWIFTKEADHRQKARCIDLEYQLRPRIIQFLLEQFGQDDQYDDSFSKFHFDVYVDSELVFIGQETPDEFVSQLGNAFESFINGGRSLSIA